MEDIQKRLASADEEERRLAVRALTGFPFQEVKKLAISALGDESWRVRKEAVDILLSFSPDEELSRELIALLAHPGNPGLRNSVVEVLQSVGEGVLPHLVEQLSHEDAGMRKFLVDIMGGIGSPVILPELSAVLDDDDPNVAAAAAESIGMIGDEAALPALLRALERDDLLIRYAILEALVKIGQPVPFSHITRIAGDPLLKKALFECLGVIGSTEAIPLLVDGIQERARNVREAALVALEAIRSRAAAAELADCIDPQLKELAGGEAVEYLMSMRESLDKKVKAAAISILGVINDIRALDVFIKEYRDENFREVSLNALREMGPVAGLQLAELFPGADDESRCIIAHISGELNLPEVSSVMLAGLDDPLPMVRALSAEAIGKTGRVELIPKLVQLLGDRQVEVSRRATGALVRLSDIARENVSGAALLLSESESPECRLQSVRLLAALRDPAHLTLLSKDENPLVRREAITSLGELRYPESAGRLSMALADEDPDVRLAAAAALAWEGFADESGALVLALDDPSERVRVAALRSLGRRQDKEAFPKIVPLMKEATGMLLIAALQTVALIDPEKALPWLEKEQHNADAEVARVARELLKKQAEAL
jgi:HEAT repeat protein